jgi:hypothetical protein
MKRETQRSPRQSFEEARAYVSSAQCCSQQACSENQFGNDLGCGCRSTRPDNEKDDAQNSDQ